MKVIVYKTKFTLAPLPRILDLVRGLIQYFRGSSSELTVWDNNSAKAHYWLSRSAWSLRLIYEWLSTLADDKPIIWFPDYFCNQSLAPLRMIGAEVRFYPITKNLSPDWSYCEKAAELELPNLFVVVHYFGFRAEVDAANSFCNKYNVLLIEDCAHVLTVNEWAGQRGDFVLWSPHKHLALPGGAVMQMWKKSPRIQKVCQTRNPVELMNSLHSKLAISSSKNYPWLLRRLLQVFLPPFILRLNNKQQSVAISNNVDFDCEPTMSKLSRVLLPIYSERIAKIKNIRRRNASLIAAGVGEFFSYNVSAKFADIPYAVLIEDDVIEKLNTHFPVQTWPDLPPEIYLNVDKHANAIELSKQYFLFHCHQSLTGKEVYKQLKLMKKKLGKQSGNLLMEYPITIENVAEEEWTPLLQKTEFSNLLQSWSYGEAKRIYEGLGVERFKFLKNGICIGMIQVLVRKCLFFRIARINRGPLFIENDLRFEDKKEVFRLLRKKYHFLKNGILIFSPELEKNNDYSFLASLSGFIPLQSRTSWCSSRINLRKSLPEIINNMKGSWRTAITAAQKLELNFSVGDSTVDLQKFLMGYKIFMREKNFEGVSSEFLQQYFDCCNASTDKPKAFLLCNDQGVAIAGVLVACHGRTCTYLAGWTLSEARGLNASNFLLWQAIQDMQSLGFYWFDLGGIDDINTPGVAAFKRGLCGEEYTLVGDYF